MRIKIVMWLFTLGVLWICGAFAQDQANALSNPMPVGVKTSIEKTATGLPLRKESIIPQGTLLRVTIAIIIGLALAVAATYLLKRYLFARNSLDSSDQRMQLLEVKRLSPRLILFRVRVDNKTMVLAQSGEQLVELDPAKCFESQNEAIDD